MQRRQHQTELAGDEVDDRQDADDRQPRRRSRLHRPTAFTVGYFYAGDRFRLRNVFCAFTLSRTVTASVARGLEEFEQAPCLTLYSANGGSKLRRKFENFRKLPVMRHYVTSLAELGRLRGRG